MQLAVTVVIGDGISGEVFRLGKISGTIQTRKKTSATISNFNLSISGVVSGAGAGKKLPMTSRNFGGGLTIDHDPHIDSDQKKTSVTVRLR